MEINRPYLVKYSLGWSTQMVFKVLPEEDGQALELAHQGGEHGLNLPEFMESLKNPLRH